jgi:hypothetical protein
VNHHCVGDNASGNQGLYCKETQQEERLTMKYRSPYLKDTVQNMVENSTSSVLFSWPDDGSVATYHHSTDVLRTLEQGLREYHPIVTTTKPFYMLDGGGRRMATLSLLGNHQEDRLCEDNISNTDFVVDAPGTWLRDYCSLRTSA